MPFDNVGYYTALHSFASLTVPEAANTMVLEIARQFAESKGENSLGKVAGMDFETRQKYKLELAAKNGVGEQRREERLTLIAHPVRRRLKVCEGHEEEVALHRERSSTNQLSLCVAT